jgi:hypothetical protein
MNSSNESYQDKIRRLAEDFWVKHGEAAHEKVSAQIKGLESSGLHSDASTWKLVREEIRRRSLPDSSQNMTAVE